ncbi:hypothetical protein CJD36_003760 [Flavipsychrobacter stenotrophus]|uniref:Uncharacterized protein n=2 Tax=Flavipsychrobacter stenotrophus TaxID=2077091 RepID=A0A2S7T1X9_9BACT|nr:hypothetical protein CJD36_003760 [Flavipsychrobacter stenotrophus]
MTINFLGVTYTDSAPGKNPPIFTVVNGSDPYYSKYHKVSLPDFYLPDCRIGMDGKRPYTKANAVVDTGLYNVGVTSDSLGNTISRYGDAQLNIGGSYNPENTYNAYPDSGSSWIHVTKADYKEVTGTINIKMYRESDSAITYLTGSFHSYK